MGNNSNEYEPTLPRCHFDAFALDAVFSAIGFFGSEQPINLWRNGMPVFSKRELKILIAAASRDRIFFRQGANALLDKCCIRPNGEFTRLGEPFYELTEYGRQVITFYDRIRAGLVKTRKEQCSSCTGCKRD